MKRSARPAMVVGLAIGVATGLASAPAADADTLPGAHEGRRRIPGVTQVVFSPDSRHVVAGYYRPAMNRPGTDWGAFVAQWDLKTGKRVIIPSAIAPLAFSPDGKTIAMGVYERSREPGKRMRAQTQLALWALGQRKPKATFVRGGGADSTVVAAAFHPGGKHIASVNDSGQLLLWQVNKRSEPVVLDHRIDENFQRYGWGRRRVAPPLAFVEEGKQLALNIPLSPRSQLTSPDITWQIDLEKRKAKRIKETLTDPGKKRDGLPASALGPDGKLKAVAQPNGMIWLVTTDDEKKTRRVLRLDDEPRSDDKR